MWPCHKFVWREILNCKLIFHNQWILMSKIDQSMYFVYDVDLEKLHPTDVCFNNYTLQSVYAIFASLRRKYIFKSRCLAELKMKKNKKRFKWLIATCWIAIMMMIWKVIMHDESILLLKHMEIMRFNGTKNNKTNMKDFHLKRLLKNWYKHNKSLFVWNRIQKLFFLSTIRT